MRVLLVEDDDSVAADVSRALTAIHCLIDRAKNGEDAWFKGDTESYDAVVLDLGLPRLDGISVLKRWRSAGMNVPVLILTARDGWRERVDGIDAGADDYLSKPFRIEELLARLRAITRRRAGLTTPVLAVGGLELDTRTRLVSVGGVSITLTALEYRLLSYLLHHQGRVASRMELIEHVYESEADRDANALELLVGRVRRKLGVTVIATRRGHGYTIEGDAA
jgi:two-component system, OmpR family, response regulator